jgi:hypothetical protein
MSICVDVARSGSAYVMVHDSSIAPPNCPAYVMLSNADYIAHQNATSIFNVFGSSDIDPILATSAFMSGLTIAAIPTLTILAISFLLRAIRQKH